jgi:hypothetical protein
MEWKGMANNFVRKYTVMISNDSLVWQNYTENGKLKVFSFEYFYSAFYVEVLDSVHVWLKTKQYYTG